MMSLSMDIQKAIYGAIKDITINSFWSISSEILRGGSLNLKCHIPYTRKDILLLFWGGGGYYVVCTEILGPYIS